MGIISLFAACDKPGGEDDTSGGGGTQLKLSYGDSILYLRNQAGNTIYNPQPTGATGRFYAYPDGLSIDETSGAINVSESETGMRYRITFVNAGRTDSVSTRIIVSGVNYKDWYHVQTQHDSLSRPSYNANFSNLGLPAGSFDITGSARSKGLAIDPATGVINLNQTIRNGFLGSNPPNDKAAREVEMSYTLQDASNSAVNKLKIKLYFYNEMATVETDIKELLRDREDMFLRLAQDGFFINPSSPVSRNTAASRPRPPCVIILRRQ